MYRVINVTKTFPQGFSLTTVNFTVQPGESIAFLGANGSGKSTLFDMLSGNTDTSAGEIYFENERLLPEKFEIRRRIGYLPQSLLLPKWVTALELFSYASSLYQLKNRRARIAASLEYWDCASYQHKPLATCSLGMQKRVGLALATLHEPTCLILDEPFSGLDLYHIHTLEEALRERKRAGQVTLLSTHIIPFVVELCDRSFVLQNGHISSLAHWEEMSSADKQLSIEKHFFN